LKAEMKDRTTAQLRKIAKRRMIDALQAQKARRRNDARAYKALKATVFDN
jgi:hypothetical protein